MKPRFSVRFSKMPSVAESASNLVCLFSQSTTWADLQLDLEGPRTSPELVGLV